MTQVGLKGLAVFLAAALLTSGCDKTRQVVGLEKQSPDEFAVVARAPLSVPPDFGLRPPRPGAARPQEKSVRNQARDVLLQGNGKNTRQQGQAASTSGNISAGEAALLASAGALNVDSSIRSTVDRETTALVEADASLFDKVLFWQDPEPSGTVVDADKESRRLREASAAGDPPNKGEVPVIKRREKGLLEGIF